MFFLVSLAEPLQDKIAGVGSVVVYVEPTLATCPVWRKWSR